MELVVPATLLGLAAYYVFGYYRTRRRFCVFASLALASLALPGSYSVLGVVDNDTPLERAFVLWMVPFLSSALLGTVAVCLRFFREWGDIAPRLHGSSRRPPPAGGRQPAPEATARRMTVPRRHGIGVGVVALLTSLCYTGMGGGLLHFVRYGRLIAIVQFAVLTACCSTVIIMSALYGSAGRRGSR
jgi:hypothetical protein